MEILLKEQSENGKYKFDSNIYLSKGFIAVYGNKATEVAFKTMDLIMQRVKEGIADYFQVAECNGVTYWIIDSEEYITFLLPDEY